MKRYTAAFSLLGKLPGKQDIRASLKKASMEFRHRLVLRESTQVDNRLLVELESDASRRKLSAILASLDTSDMHFEAISWGWLLSDTMLQDTVTADEKVYTVHPRHTYELTDTQLYTYGSGMTSMTVSYGILFLTSLIAFAVGTFDTVHALAVFGPDIVLLMRFLCPLLALAAISVLFYRVSSIRCDLDSIEVRYSLRPSRRLAWQEIVELKIYRAYGEQWCSIHGISGILRFPIGDFIELGNKDVLIVTVIKQAALMYVEGILWENTVYKRADAP